jgi:DNA repair protein RadD
MTPLELRTAQLRLVQMAREELIAGRNRIVAYGPTGFGKSVVIEAMTRNAIAKGKRVGIIANRIHLVRALSQRFTDSGINHGIVQGDNSFNTNAQVIICSIQTVARRGMPLVDVIIIDEGHACAGSKDYRKVIHHNSNMPIISFTATPFSKGMAKPQPEIGGEPLFHSLIVPTTIRELIDDGLLVDCDIYAPSDPDLTGVRSQRNQFGEMDYNEQDLAKAVDTQSLVGDIVSHWQRMAGGKPTVCFATSIAHSKHIVAQFEAAGVKARHVDCYLDQEEKDEILDSFKRGEFTVLSNVALIAEGFDYPACACMILARPTKSLIRYIQMVGRVLRTHDSKTRALVLDHSGTAHILGYPTDDLPLELCDGSPKKAAQKEAVKKEPKKCPKCSYMKPGGKAKCPQCGFEAVRKPEEVEVIDGELKLVERISAKKADKLNKQDVYSQLLAMQHERKYSDGWTSNQYRNLFGCWPKGLERSCKEPTQEVRNYVKGRMIRFAKSKEIKRAA